MGHHREILYAADVAKIRGTTPRAGRALLAALERKHGSKVVGRDGDKLFITRRNLARFLPGLEESSADADPHFRQLYRQVQAMAHVMFDDVECTNELREGQESMRARLDVLERRLAVMSDFTGVSPCVVARLDDGGGSHGGRERKFARQRVGGHDRAGSHPRVGVPESCPPPSTRSSASSANLRAAAPRLPMTVLTETETETEDAIGGTGGADSTAPARTRCETADEELARLIREQREDQRQDRFGLRSTVTGDVLRGVGVVDDPPAPRRPPRPGESDDE